MSFIFNANEIYEGQSLSIGDAVVELDFDSDFRPDPILQVNDTINPFLGLELIQLDQSFVDAMLGRGIPVGEGSASSFVGQPGIFATNAIPGLTAPSNDSFAFDFFIDNGGNEDLNDFIPLVVAVASAAMEYLGQFIVAADGASLEVGISLLQQGPTTLASAGAASFFLGGQNAEGVVEIFTGTQIELVTGNDPNGDAVDIFININTDFLTQPSAFFGTDPDRVVPNGSLDYVSILVHEILHGLGFFSFRDNSGADAIFDLGAGPVAIESTYGLNVSFEDVGENFLSATYDSANIREVYGSEVQLETTFNNPGSDVSHFALFNPDGSIADTALALMNPASNRSDVSELGLLELAVLQDLFYTVNIPEGTRLLNEFDILPFTPTISTPSSIIFDGGVGISVELDASSLFVSLPGSVGIEVSTLDGQSFSDRLVIPSDATELPFLFSEDVLRAIVETDIAAVDVRLFNPAQLDLASGTNDDTVRLVFIADLDQGTDGNDVMEVNLNVPSIYFAGAGQDVLRGNANTDIFYGEDGDDFLFGFAGDDSLYGGNGNDYLGGASGNDTLDGGAGNDRIYAGSGDDIAFGGEGDDRVEGGGGDDTLSGGMGDDSLRGDIGDDILLGEEGDDFLGGGAGDDRLEGGSGDDLILGGSGDDIIVGGTGNDIIDGQANDDLIIGGAGNDTIAGGNGDDLIAAGEGIDVVRAGAGNDVVFGDDGNDVLNGNAGDDVLTGGLGNDRLLGGSGSDELFGGQGNDSLNGGGGNDILEGGLGEDILFGSGGSDTFVAVREGGTDTIIDFEDGIDMLDLSDFTDAEIQASLDGIQNVNGDAVLQFADGTTFVLLGIDGADITADDILNFDGADMMIA